MNRLARITRDFMAALDRAAGTSLKPRLGDLYRWALRTWSPVRRRIDPLKVRLRFGLLGPPDGILRLHLGCGPKRLPGHVNVDLWITEATDLVLDISRLPWPDASVDSIESHHVVEHIPHTAVEAVLREWARVLKPGGGLFLETPDFDMTLREYLEGNEQRLLSIFGRQRRKGDYHYFGFNPKRLQELLERLGFEEFKFPEPQSHQAQEEPVFRVECEKAP